MQRLILVCAPVCSLQSPQNENYNNNNVHYNHCSWLKDFHIVIMYNLKEENHISKDKIIHVGVLLASQTHFKLERVLFKWSLLSIS